MATTRNYWPTLHFSLFRRGLNNHVFNCVCFPLLWGQYRRAPNPIEITVTTNIFDIFASYPIFPHEIPISLVLFSVLMACLRLYLLEVSAVLMANVLGKNKDNRRLPLKMLSTFSLTRSMTTLLRYFRSQIHYVKTQYILISLKDFDKKELKRLAYEKTINVHTSAKHASASACDENTMRIERCAKVRPARSRPVVGGSDALAGGSTLAIAP